VPSGRDTNQNRLIKVTSKAFKEGAVELHFVYDYQGRRISKERRLYNPASMKFEFEKRIEYMKLGIITTASDTMTFQMGGG
jgi:hypothetical protein